MHASFSGNIECVRLLLENGADMSIKDKHGETAKDLAKGNRRHCIVPIIEEVWKLENQGIGFK